MKETKSKKLTNTEIEYEDALATSDPTKISETDLQDLAKKAVKNSNLLVNLNQTFIIWIEKSTK
jgi:uncharacterized protein (DUF111 family)